jgi:hypothetical protein
MISRGFITATPRHTTLCSDAARHVTEAMGCRGVRRLLVLSRGGQGAAPCLAESHVRCRLGRADTASECTLGAPLWEAPLGIIVHLAHPAPDGHPLRVGCLGAAVRGHNPLGVGGHHPGDPLRVQPAPIHPISTALLAVRPTPAGRSGHLGRRWQA